MARPTVDRDQVRALHALQRGFGRGQVEVTDVCWNPPAGATPAPRAGRSRPSGAAMRPGRIVTVRRDHAGDYDLVCVRCGFLGTARGPYATGAEDKAACHADAHQRERWG